MKLNEIYNDDCLTIMPQIGSESVDMILCDLPFGITANQWDKIINYDALWNEYKRIIKENGVIALFATMRFASRLIETSKVPFRYDLVWQKKCPVGFLNCKKMPMRNHELILIFYKKLPTYNPQMRQGFKPTRKGMAGPSGNNYRGHKPYPNREGATDRYPVSVIDLDDKPFENKLHPTQKPLNLLAHLVKTYTNEGDLILDNCAGSGSTLVAAKNHKRNYIGIEKEKKYFDIAKERLSL